MLRFLELHQGRRLMMERKKKADEKFCQECGEIIRIKAEICPKCGCRQPSLGEISSQSAGSAPIVEEQKSRITAALLAIFLGGFGVHKFYLGRPIQGLIYLVCIFTFIPSLIGFVEGVYYLFLSDREFQEKLGAGKLDFVGSKKTQGPSPDTHVKCPDCRELIPIDARVCRFCGCKLVPQPTGNSAN